MQLKEVQAVAEEVRQPLVVFQVTTEDQLAETFAVMSSRNIAAVLYGASQYYQVISERLIALAARYRIPALYEWRDFVTAGGLMSYSTERSEPPRQAAVYAARILKGERPENLPVVRSTHFELAINLKTAKELGLTVPPTLLARADEVIE